MVATSFNTIIVSQKRAPYNLSAHLQFCLLLRSKTYLFERVPMHLHPAQALQIGNSHCLISLRLWWDWFTQLHSGYTVLYKVLSSQCHALLWVLNNTALNLILRMIQSKLRNSIPRIFMNPVIRKYRSRVKEGPIWIVCPSPSFASISC